MATGDYYTSAFSKGFSGLITWGTSVKAALLTATYTPSLTTHVFFSDLTNEASGTGYTAGGQALTSPTVTNTVANSWGTTAAVSTAYAAGAIVKPSGGNTYLYRCITAGTSGGSAPGWPTTVGLTVTDGTVVWLNVGTAVTVLGASNPSWSATGGSLTARYCAFYYSTGTGSTSPLIGLIDAGANVTATNASFTVQADSFISGFFPTYSS